jgi:hypothetical protein
MSNKLITILFILPFFTKVLHADEIKCIGYSGFNPTNSIVELAGDCGLQKNIVQDKVIQDEHRKYIYTKLAEKLAKQIKQNSEDISLLTTFYNANGQDLMMNSEDVAQSCRLDSVKTIENCGGKKTGPFQEMKLALLKDKLPKVKNTPFKNDQSLYGIMAGKFYSDLGMKEGNDLQCPLQDTSGSFILKSQIDDLSADNIIELLKTSDGDSSTTFDRYAQLKIINSTNDPAFIESFKQYIKSKPKNKNSKEHISSFFFDQNNQKKIAPTLANQCKSMNKNLNEFLCSDLTEMGSLDDETSQNLFNKLNTTDSMEDQYEVDFSKAPVLTAYGMQCLAKENHAKNPEREKSSNYQSIDQWYADFTKNTRDEESAESNKNIIKNFCSSYTCQTPQSKQQNSCKKGGPLASNELAQSLGCNLTPRSDLCTSDVLKTISYMENLEKLKNDSKDKIATTSNSPETSSSNSSTNSKEEKIVSGRLPNFASNYFGVEGSLKALGKPVTTFAISEKKQEFAENKLASVDPVYKTPEVMKAQQTKSPSMVAVENNSSIRPAYTPTQVSQNSGRSQSTSSVIPTYEPTIKSPVSRTKAKEAFRPDSSNESSRLRDEMEKMIADIKSTKEEITASKETIANSGSSLGNKAYGATSNLASPVNRAEQERLKRLEQSLNDKSNRLEEYRRELDNRNFAQSGIQGDGANRATASSGAGGSSGSAGGSGGALGGGSANSGSSAALKLTAGSNSKADGKNANMAALIQSGVESSTLSVDELSKLSPDNLKKLGIDSTRPFTLKVTFESITYEVPVKSFVYKGNNILGPIMNPKNKELNDFLLKSPLFKQYIDYKFEKEPQHI